MMDYLISNLWVLWASVFLICLIAEMGSGDMYLLSLSVAAALTAVISLTGISFYLQLFLFCIFSLLTILFVRPPLIERLHKSGEDRQSNADAIIGTVGRVSEAIPDGGYGRVQLGGDDWKAQSADGTSVDKDEKVRVTARESVIITVEKV